MKRFEFGKNNRDKRNTNNVNNLENSKSKKKISKDIKAKFSNLEIKPQFLIIGLVVIITVISLIYFIFLKYSPIMNFKYEGYAVRGKEITENLLGAASDKEKGNAQNVDSSDNDVKNIDLAKIEEEGTIFKKLGQYFIGSKEKTEIDLNYPIYINDKSTIYNLSQDITLISKDFEKVAGYPNISITDGKVYNGNSLERSDSKEYIFARTNEEIYINLKEIKINTTANEYIVPANSLIVFEEEEIKYYRLAENILLFNKINDVDYNAQVTIKNIEENAQTSLGNNAQNDVKKVDNKYQYEELLTRLGIIENAKNDVENAQEEIEQEDLSENKTEADKKDDTENEVDSNEQKEEQLENSENVNTKFVKPEVTAEPFTAEVYSAKSTLHIKDTTARIVEAPTFEIYKDGKIYLRRVFKSQGEIQITGLVPETEYEITGKYIYLNAENKKIENTFYKGTIKTKGYEALGTIELSKEEGEIYSNKIQIKNVKIISDLQNEAIKGINQIELETGKIRTVLKNGQVNDLLQGKEVTIESSEGLQSNKNIEYAIKFYDKNGIELNISNNLGKTKTSKQKPTVKITTKSQDIVSVTLGIRLTNKDNVNLENYKYIITRPNGEKLKEEKLSEDEKEIKLEDLDQNQYYKIAVYADYDLGNNKGMQQTEELGNLVFATKPISTLGSLELRMENKELTSTSTKLDYKIDEEKTDNRLIQILNGLRIKIKEKLKDTQEKNEKYKEIAYEHILTEEEIIQLKQGKYNSINCENLQANTTYEIDIEGNIKLGKTEEEIPITYTYKEFTTLKIPAKVEIKNQFVTGNLIDFDVRIEDVNNSVLNNKVRMELRDEKANLLDLQEIETNEDYVRKTYEKLSGNHRYKLSFYADQYNIGNTDKTYKVNYLIKEIEIITEQGISGSIGLTELTKKATGKNLVDVSSNIKWYVYPNFNTGDYYGKEYNEETKILTLGGHGNYRRAVYDLREYAGQEVTMSFKAKAVSGKQNAYIQNSKKDANRTVLKELTEEWKEYQCTLNVDDTGYLGFYVAGGNGIEIKELQVELGNKKTSYEEFRNMLQSNFIINLEDKKNEITTNDYYIKIYKENELVQEERYEEIPENNIVENEVKTYATEAGKKYVIQLSIKIKEREYLISKIEYSTKETEEIKGIYSVEDFLEIQPNGNYIVLNDLDFTGTSYRFGGEITFNGILNFNGNRIITDVSTDKTCTLIANVGTNGIIENLEVDVKYNNNIELNYSSAALIANNYGTIRNINVNLVESNKYPNFRIALIASQNKGTIENFVINLEETMYAKSESGVICFENTGIIKNGYIYGKNVNADFIRNDGASVSIGIIAYSNSGNGQIKNIYSLVNVDVSNQENIVNNVGNIVSINNSNALVENVYSVGLGNNITNRSAGPNIYYADGKISNNYYFNDEIFTNKYHKKTTMLALHDTKFQSQLLNSDNRFNVDEYVSKGYYPQLIMPSVMPNNEYIELPEVKDADLADILSTEVVKKGIDTVEVKFNVYNPSAETITNIKIKNLECTILSQTYENKRSEIVAKLHSPKLYTSTYSVLGITTQGAFNIPYTREFLEHERTIEVDLYKKINNISEWKDINNSPTENYILMRDLNFANMGTR